MKFLFYILLILTSFEVKAQTFKQAVEPEPSFSTILKAASQVQGLSQDRFKKWQKKIKASGWLPTLYTGYDHAFRESQGLSVNDNISISSGNVTIGPEDNDYDFDSNLGQTFRVRAVWKLDNVMFNRNLFQLEKDKKETYKLRQNLSESLMKVYAKRRALLKKFLILKRSGAITSSNRVYEQYNLLTEYLDFLTANRFHSVWYRRSK